MFLYDIHANEDAIKPDVDVPMPPNRHTAASAAKVPSQGPNPPAYHHPTANSADTLSIWWLDSSLNLITGQVNIWQWILLDPQISSYYEGKLHKALAMVRASCLGSDFTYEEVKSHVEKVRCACMCT